jgi:hypothetical protein
VRDNFGGPAVSGGLTDRDVLIADACSAGDEHLELHVIFCAGPYMDQVARVTVRATQDIEPGTPAVIRLAPDRRVVLFIGKTVLVECEA